MKQVQIITIIIVAAAFSFCFGWVARGDAIYSGMFHKEVAMLEKLPMGIMKK